MKLTFRLDQTPAARKSFKISPELKKALRQCAREVASLELPAVSAFTLGIVTMDDEELRELNISALSHDFYTDILTFEIDRTESILEAELYFSVDRALENAMKHKVSIEKELLLLTIHGILHLAGYDDHELAERRRMLTQQRGHLARLEHLLQEKPAKTGQ